MEKTMTVKVYMEKPYGRSLVAIINARAIESLPETDSAYCKTFSTRFFGSGVGEWTTIWSDSLSWEI
jgi:hypothetical protein